MDSITLKSLSVWAGKANAELSEIADSGASDTEKDIRLDVTLDRYLAEVPAEYWDTFGWMVGTMRRVVEMHRRLAVAISLDDPGVN